MYSREREREGDSKNGTLRNHNITSNKWSITEKRINETAKLAT